MNLPSKGELQALMAQQKTPCISIFLPTHREGVEMRQDMLRFRNQIREAEHLLLLKNVRSSQVEDVLKPIRTLVEDEQFWLHPGNGLAVFRSPEVFRTYRLPYQFKEQVVVTTHFYFRQLLALVLDSGRFYILALSEKEIRLLESTHDSVHEIDLPEAVPRSLTEAMKYDEPENEVQYHSSASDATIRKGGQHAAIFHGQGVGVDEEKGNILPYFHMVDQGLHELLRDEKVPLVLVGLEFLFPIYLQANTYPHLLHEGVPGNPDRESAEVLRKQAWPVVAPYFKKSREEAAASYNSYKGAVRASNDIGTIIPAAFCGRVACLFMTKDQEQWGTFNLRTGALHVHQKPRFGDDDLLDIAASQTLLHDGQVYVVEQVDMPDDGPLAAVLRY
jgi:hypothetical protein